MAPREAGGNKVRSSNYESTQEKEDSFKNKRVTDAQLNPLPPVDKKTEPKMMEEATGIEKLNDAKEEIEHDHERSNTTAEKKETPKVSGTSRKKESEKLETPKKKDSNTLPKKEESSDVGKLGSSERFPTKKELNDDGLNQPEQPGSNTTVAKKESQLRKKAPATVQKDEITAEETTCETILSQERSEDKAKVPKKPETSGVSLEAMNKPAAVQTEKENHRPFKMDAPEADSPKRKTSGAAETPKTKLDSSNQPHIQTEKENIDEKSVTSETVLPKKNLGENASAKQKPEAPKVTVETVNKTANQIESKLHQDVGNGLGFLQALKVYSAPTSSPNETDVNI